MHTRCRASCVQMRAHGSSLSFAGYANPVDGRQRQHGRRARDERGDRQRRAPDQPHHDAAPPGVQIPRRATAAALIARSPPPATTAPAGSVRPISRSSSRRAARRSSPPGTGTAKREVARGPRPRRRDETYEQGEEVAHPDEDVRLQSLEAMHACPHSEPVESSHAASSLIEAHPPTNRTLSSPSTLVAPAPSRCAAAITHGPVGQHVDPGRSRERSCRRQRSPTRPSAPA